MCHGEMTVSLLPKATDFANRLQAAAEAEHTSVPVLPIGHICMFTCDLMYSPL